MRNSILTFSEKTFDFLFRLWESKTNQKILGSLFVSAFLLSLLFIWFKNLELVPTSWTFIPKNYFVAVDVAFTILLGVEVIGMVFVLAKSVADSVAKQFEIFSLILLRNAFKEFDNYHNIVSWENGMEPVFHMFANALGGLAIFVMIIIFTRIKLHKRITEDDAAQARFNSVKKFVSLLMLVGFVGIGIDDFVLLLTNNEPFNFFTGFYTLLIFTDILIVLISLRYSQMYIVVFRNSAFALATVMIRIALTAPVYWNVTIGIVSAGFVLLTSYFYNKFRKIESLKL